MRNPKLLKYIQLSMLIAIMLVLQISGLGFLMIPPVSITTMVIPVIVGAVVLGPGAGAILGGIFGLLSMYNASTIAVSPTDLAFSPFLSGSPVSSVIMCLGCRILFGFIAGLIFKLLVKKVNVSIASVAASVIGVVTHTGTVMFCLWSLFPKLGVEFKTVISTIFSLNILAEVAMATVFALAFAHLIPILNKKITQVK